MKRENRKVGVEFELTGLSRSSPSLPSEFRGYFCWHSDSSIESSVVTGMEECIHCGQMHETTKRMDTGELVVNPPQQESFYMEGDTIEKAFAWLKANNPSVMSTGDMKCSAHIHVSAERKELIAIAEYGMKHQEKAFRIWKPFAGRVGYCAKYDTDRSAESIAHGTADRYVWLNISCAFDKHNTVEFRIFDGTMDANEVKRRVKWCVQFVEDAIRVYNNKKERERKKALRLQKIEAKERAKRMAASAVTGTVTAPVLPTMSAEAREYVTRTSGTSMFEQIAEMSVDGRSFQMPATPRMRRRPIPMPTIRDDAGRPITCLRSDVILQETASGWEAVDDGRITAQMLWPAPSWERTASVWDEGQPQPALSADAMREAVASVNASISATVGSIDATNTDE